MYVFVAFYYSIRYNKFSGSNEKETQRYTSKPIRNYKIKAVIIMNITEPIRSTETIIEIQRYLRSNAKPRDEFLFVLLINVGLRIGDALPLKVRDIMDGDLIIVEQKTNKHNRFHLDEIRPEINAYIRYMDPNDYLFPSNKGGHISRVTAFKILQKAGDKFDIQLSSHSLRKSFGYHYYNRTKNLAYLQDIFNHARPSITKKYIGLNDDEKKESLRGFKLTE